MNKRDYILKQKLKKIWPGTDDKEVQRFKNYLKRNKGNVESSLYSHGFVGMWELDKYPKEVKEIKKFLKENK